MPRGLMKRTLSYRPAPDSWSDVPHAEVYDLARRPAAVAFTALRDGASRLSVKRPLTFTLWAVAVWLRKRADRREMREATNQLFVAPDQILEDLGVSRDEMLAKSMCHEDRSLDAARDETESDRQ